MSERVVPSRSVVVVMDWPGTWPPRALVPPCSPLPARACVCVCFCLVGTGRPVATFWENRFLTTPPTAPRTRTRRHATDGPRLFRLRTHSLPVHTWVSELLSLLLAACGAPRPRRSGMNGDLSMFFARSHLRASEGGRGARAAGGEGGGAGGGREPPSAISQRRATVQKSASHTTHLNTCLL